MKRVKNLGILGGILLILCILAVVVVKLSPDETEEEVAADPIVAIEADSVTSLSWDYTELVSFDREDGAWVYHEDASFPVDPTHLDAMLETLSSIVPIRTVDEPGELEDYGLTSPLCTVTVTADGTETEILLGHENELGDARYLSIGDGKVYLVDTDILDSFQYTLYDNLQYETVPAISDVQKLTVTSETQNYTLERKENSGLAYSDSYVWFRTDDGSNLALDNEKLQTLLDSLTAVSWNGCTEYRAEDLSAYGLDAPAAVVTLDYLESYEEETDILDDDGNPVMETKQKDASFTLEFGDYLDDACYARIGGSDMVYTVDASLLDTILYTTMDDLQPDEILLMDWDTVDTIDITVGGKSYTVERSVQETESDDGETTEETVWLLDGQEVNISGVLSELVTLTSTGTAEEPEVSRELLFSMVLHRNTEEYQTITISFTEYDSTSCIARRDDEQPVYTDRTVPCAAAEVLQEVLEA